jgi:tetratricopeptide (TPR) repeat protein
MPHATLLRAAASGILCVAACGCSTMKTPGASKNPLVGWFTPKPKLQEPPPIQVPSKLSEPRTMNIAYARWMLETGKLEEARAKYQIVLKEDEHDIEALIGMGQVEERCGRSEAAVNYYKQAVALAPEKSITHAALGRYYGNAHQWPQAIESLNQAVLNNPTDQTTRLQLAVAIAHTGNVDGALPHIIGAGKNDAEAHYIVAVVLRDEGLRDQAEQQVRIALAKNPQMMEARQLITELSPRGRQSQSPVVPVAHSTDVSSSVRTWPIVNPAESEVRPAAAIQTGSAQIDFDRYPG